MTKRSKVLKNFDITIEDGLQKITELVAAIDRDCKLSKIKQNLYQTVLEVSE